MNVNDPAEQAKVAAEALRLLPKVAAENAELRRKVAGYERRDRIWKLARALWPNEDERAKEIKKLAALPDAKLVELEGALSTVGTSIVPATGVNLGEIESSTKTAADSIQTESENARRRLDELLLRGFSPDDE